MRHKLAMLAREDVDPRLLRLLVDVQEEAVLAVPEAPKLTPIQESEHEDALNEWLDEHEVPNGWELAPIFVGAGTTPEFLDFIDLNGITLQQAAAARQVASADHNSRETPLFAQSIERRAVARSPL